MPSVFALASRLSYLWETHTEARMRLRNGARLRWYDYPVFGFLAVLIVTCVVLMFYVMFQLLLLVVA